MDEQNFVEARAVADQFVAGFERERVDLRAARPDIRDRDDFTLARALGEYQLIAGLRARAALVGGLRDRVRRHIHPQHHAER